jgi:hypothetical protein
MGLNGCDDPAGGYPRSSAIARDGFASDQWRGLVHHGNR